MRRDGFPRVRFAHVALVLSCQVSQRWILYRRSGSAHVQLAVGRCGADERGAEAEVAIGFDEQFLAHDVGRIGQILANDSDFIGGRLHSANPYLQVHPQ